MNTQPNSLYAWTQIANILIESYGPYKVKPGNTAQGFKVFKELIDMNSINLNEIEAILVSCGVNDIDYSSDVDVHKYIVDTVNKILRRNPDIKIIIGELTPRKDVKVQEVNICNQMLIEWKA